MQLEVVIFAPGDIVGKGSLLKGDVVSLLPTNNNGDEDEQFQVIKELGHGSYLVHQVLVIPSASAPDSTSSRGRSSNEDGQILGHVESERPLANLPPSKTYGRKFAIKCLSKTNLDQEELNVQMAEITIHQSLPLHPNIVALHKTLQTSSYLLLVLEYVPGEDILYFLQQTRNHHPPFPEDLSNELPQQQTPLTSSLLSSSHLLSRTRLRLIASMFAQMCDAVATCHAAGVFHRDIKPENFIVTGGRYLDEGKDWTNGGKKGRVVVKLTDFSLSTREEECSDMDCGSAPYMSYECRNNTTSTYRPREADVWSLGIVLINMLYHINPWTDTAHGACSSFAAFRQDPVFFFTRLFTGMTPYVAWVLAWRVFGVDNEQTRASERVNKKRMTAAELGVWVRSNLVDLMAMNEGSSSAVGVNGTSTQVVVNGGYNLLSQMRLSHRPVSRSASPFGRLLGLVGCEGAVPSQRPLAMRAPSLAPALEKEAEVEGEVTLQIEGERGDQEAAVQQLEEETDQADATLSRTSVLRNKAKVATSIAAVAIKGQQQDQQQHDEASQSLVKTGLLHSHAQVFSSPATPRMRDVASSIAIMETAIHNVNLYRRQCEYLRGRCLNLLNAIQDAGLNETSKREIQDDLGDVVEQIRAKIAQWSTWSRLKCVVQQQDMKDGIDRLNKELDGTLLKFSVKFAFFSDNYTSTQEWVNSRRRELLLAILESQDNMRHCS